MKTPALLDENLLRLFDALYAARSVSGAAEMLGYAQPTVSIWLGQLRRALDDQLFVRTGAGMVPTPRADALIETARTAIAALRLLTDQPRPFDPRRDARTFRICMTDASHVTLLPRILAALRSSAPRVRIEALQIDGSTASRLQSGEAALALGFIPSLEKGFYQQALYSQDWVCLVRSGHPRITGPLTRVGYRQEAHVGIAYGTGSALLEAALVRERVERDVAVQLPGFLGLPAIVSGTDLIATLPRNIGETLATSNDLVLHACPIHVRGFKVKQHWHARYHQDPANQWLRQTCAALFQTSKSARGKTPVR